MEIWQFLLLFGVGMVAGVINVSAGGGSSLTLPALIFMGLDGAVANGTNRVAILIQNIFAIASFRQSHFSDFRTSMKMAVWALPGAVTGAIVAVRVGNELFEKILAVVLIGVIISMMLPRKWDQPVGEGTINPWLYPAMFGIGFYGGFIQVGVGFLIMSALYYLLRTSLVRVNMHKVFIVFIYTLPALGIFIYNDKVNWGLGLALAAGNSLGAWWAARFSVRKGDRFVRYVLFAAIILVVLKLLDVF